jgi:hypothetical protein
MQLADLKKEHEKALQGLELKHKVQINELIEKHKSELKDLKESNTKVANIFVYSCSSIDLEEKN